jgi:hypothetical protein
MLYANEDDIAKLFASVNPYWDEAAWQGLLQNLSYLEETLIWTLHRNGYGEAIAKYDDIYANIDNIIDYMLDGLLKQFYSPSAQGPTG